MIILDTKIVLEYLTGNQKTTEIVDDYSKASAIGIIYISQYELLKYSNKNK